MPNDKSPFSSQQRIWIVTKYAQVQSLMEVRRAFRKEFKVSSPVAYDLGMMETPYPKLCEVKHHVSDQGYGWVTDGGTGPFILTTI